MDTHNELKAMMDINLKTKFDLAINEVIEKSYQEDAKKLGSKLALIVKSQWIQMKPYLFLAYCLGAKAQAMPDNSLSRLKNTIAAHYDIINDVMHEEGYDDKSFGQLMALDFVEEVIDEMIEAQEPTND